MLPQETCDGPVIGVVDDLRAGSLKLPPAIFRGKQIGGQKDNVMLSAANCSDDLEHPHRPRVAIGSGQMMIDDEHLSPRRRLLAVGVNDPEVRLARRGNARSGDHPSEA